MRRYLDTGSIAVGAMTLGLFIAALFVKGMTHDLFLEGGVFLVSIKIIMMIYKNSISTSRLERKIDAMLAAKADPKESHDNFAGPEKV